jgi:hypothetical protein
MLQGIVVFSDGRNNTRVPDDLLKDLAFHAEHAKVKVPIFVVAVGVDRPQVRYDFVDLRAPKVIRPEDQFRVTVDVNGEGLPDEPVPILLEVTRPKKAKDGKDITVKDQKTGQDVPVLTEINLVETEGKPGEKKSGNRIVIPLGKTILVPLPEEVHFDKSTPPTATIDFSIDPLVLAKAAGKDLNSPELRGKKWELEESRPAGSGDIAELRFVAVIPKHKLEVYEHPTHRSDKIDMQVIRKPLSVLLFASGPTRDYQFVRTLMVREMEKERMQVAIHLQLPPGVAHEGILQDVAAKRFLQNFPDKFDTVTDDSDAKLMDLANYDVIIAFDPDWTALTETQLNNVQKWVDRGGGLIALGGPINTLQLARPGANKDKLKPILDLYPVVLKDIRIEEMDRKPDRPWPLSFEGASPQDHEFMKLSDAVDRGTGRFLSDWEEFFGHQKDNPDRTVVTRGFFGYYPVEIAKVGSIVIARFMDPSAKDKNGLQQPFIVTTPPASNRRVVWIGSGEMWRLRMYKEIFHERFWTKLARYVGSSNQGAATSRIKAYVGRKQVANKPFDVQYKLEGKGGKPLDPNEKPVLIVRAPEGVSPKDVPTGLTLKAKPGSVGWFTAKIQLRVPADYALEVKVPSTNDTDTSKLTVVPANPELDNTKPDFELLYRMATDANQVLARPGVDKQELKRRLTRPKLETKFPDKSETSTGAASPEDTTRLFFDLKNADLIPGCMDKDYKDSRSLGQAEDLWERGCWEWGKKASGKPEHLISWVLMAVVTLLSAEWLIRKLLRLA